MNQELLKTGSATNQDDIGTITLTYENNTFTSESIHLGKQNPGYITAYKLKNVNTGEGGTLDHYIVFGFPSTDSGYIDEDYEQNQGLTPPWELKLGQLPSRAIKGHLRVAYRDNNNNASGKVEMKLESGLNITATFDTNNIINDSQN